MTPDEIEAERERCFDGHKQPENNYAECVWDGWFRRTLIARAEQAELRAEIERLRERVRELLKNELYMWIQQFPSSEAAWNIAGDRILGMAQQVGCWFDQGNEVPLDKWRARMGGAG